MPRYRATWLHTSLCAYALFSATASLQAATVPALISGPSLSKLAEILQLPLKNSDRPTLLIFLSARCPCSMSHEETLRTLAEDFSEFRFIGIHSNTDEPAQESREHFQKANLPFPVLQDEHAKLADLLGAFKTPHVFIIGKTGDILYQGGVDNSHNPARATQPYLRNALLAVRAKNPVEVAQARALGCIIKR